MVLKKVASFKLRYFSDNFCNNWYSQIAIRWCHAQTEIKPNEGVQQYIYGLGGTDKCVAQIVSQINTLATPYPRDLPAKQRMFEILQLNNTEILKACVRHPRILTLPINHCCKVIQVLTNPPGAGRLSVHLTYRQVGQLLCRRLGFMHLRPREDIVDRIYQMKKLQFSRSQMQSILIKGVCFFESPLSHRVHPILTILQAALKQDRLLATDCITQVPNILLDHEQDVRARCQQVHNLVRCSGTSEGSAGEVVAELISDNPFVIGHPAYVMHLKVELLKILFGNITNAAQYLVYSDVSYMHQDWELVFPRALFMIRNHPPLNTHTHTAQEDRHPITTHSTPHNYDHEQSDHGVSRDDRGHSIGWDMGDEQGLDSQGHDGTGFVVRQGYDVDVVGEDAGSSEVVRLDIEGSIGEGREGDVVQAGGVGSVLLGRDDGVVTGSDFHVFNGNDWDVIGDVLSALGSKSDRQFAEKCGVELGLYQGFKAACKAPGSVQEMMQHIGRIQKL